MSELASFRYDGGELVVTDLMKELYQKDGFIIVKNLASKEELRTLEEALTGTEGLSKYSYGNATNTGSVARMSLWNHPGTDTTGVWTRTRKMAGTAEQLLGGKVYHYHSKLMLKEARTGGEFVWHQDYGYWYNFACLFPELMTVFLAIDRCGKDNGCLRVLKGSHRCGRINHGVRADQQGADLERLAELQKVLPEVHVDLEPGDALFFHCNLLHTSAANTSEHRRWALLTAYNRDSNGPVREQVHGMYKPMTLVDNDAVLKLGVNRNFEGKCVLEKKNGIYKQVSGT